MAERLYYTDSFLSDFRARVTDVREVSRTAGQSLWQLALDRTAFYPASGGQPGDMGSLRAASRSGTTIEVPVIDVQEGDVQEGDLQEGAGQGDAQANELVEVWHFTEKPLAQGTEVEAAIDWPRRLDHMQQHSGQHLLSAVFAAQLQALTVSFHLGVESSTIDLAGEGIVPQGLERVERVANGIIAEDRAISAKTVSRDEAVALLAAGRLRKLPERAGAMRLVEIDHYDLNACGGTHLRATGQIGGIHLRSMERVRHGIRVEFVCGQRAAAAARRDHALLSRASALLSTAPAELPPAVERLLAEAKSSVKEQQKLREELAQYHAARLIAEEPVDDGLRIVRRVFADRDAAYSKLLASRVVGAAGQTVALIASTQQEPGTVVMAASKGLGFSSADLMREQLATLGFRGGGSPGMAQGQAPRGQMEALLDELARAVRALK